MMKSTEFVNKLVDIAKNKKTLYVMGCFGAPMTKANKKRYTTNHPYNQQPTRAEKINNANEDTFGFDCVCLIKGILWGWNGDKSKTYGGATYASNGVKDYNTEGFINNLCKNVKSDLSKIKPGEMVWIPGHVGVYVGDGNVVECTPIWSDGVQLVKLSARKWEKCGQIVYIDYSDQIKTVSKTVDELAREVINGRWGNGQERRNRLEAAGYNYQTIQDKVNQILRG